MRLRKPAFSFAAPCAVRLACRMAGQPSHMPPGGSPNNLCHSPGPAHAPDPQVSPLPLSAERWGLDKELGSLTTPPRRSHFWNVSKGGSAAQYQPGQP